MVTAVPELPAVATRVHTRVLVLPLLSVPSRRQPVMPAGLDTVALLFSVSAMIKASPVCTPAGTTTRCDVVLRLAEACATKVIGLADGGDTTTLWFVVALAPSSSTTVTLTL